jgi:prepilin-type N-terminal cleavage/methylation domain-containing protein
MTETVIRPRDWTMTLTKRYRLRARRGFSLMEMLIVVILIGIVMSVAGVRVSSMMTQQRVIRAAGTIQTQLETAYAMAGRNREPMKIAVTTTSSAMTLKVTNRDGSKTFGTPIDFKVLGLPTGSVTSSSSGITVFPNGFASDTLSIKISVTRSSTLYRRIVRMSRAGLVKVI